MREGGLEAPKRHPIAWRDDEFYDPAKLDAELRRGCDICHGCRRCFNLCDSFPRLFDLIDASPSGELDGVASADFAPVAAACTLCDMCFMTKCPYVPPHPFALDFPHLMLRQRAAAARAGEVAWADRELAKTDRNGRLASLAAPLANWATNTENRAARAALEKTAGLHREAELPKYASHTLAIAAAASPATVNREAPGFGRKAVLYATCFGNYNDTGVGLAARAVLARNGVETEVVYPRCCGMPLLEQGLLGEVAAHAEEVAGELGAWIARGYDVIALVPSCALMLKFEWPLLLPENEAVRKLADATYDVSEYIVDIARKNGLAPGLRPVPGGVTLHMACHARAQNMGQKAAEMLRFIPEMKVSVVERCSGHGGAWGFKRENFPVALKIGRPAARAAKNAGQRFLTSECPLAGAHLRQTMTREADGGDTAPELLAHPIRLLALSYGLDPEAA